MAKVGMTVWWIEQDTGEIHSHHFHSVPNNGSYEAEVRIKYSRDPIDFLFIPDNRPDMHVFLEDMKSKSAQMKKEIAEKAAVEGGKQNDIVLPIS